MEQTTPSDLRPLTHPPAACQAKVTAGHLQVHMSYSGLLSAFLHLRLISESALTGSGPHISPRGVVWDISHILLTFMCFCAFSF